MAPGGERHAYQPVGGVVTLQGVGTIRRRNSYKVHSLLARRSGQFEKFGLGAFAGMVLTRSRRHTATGTGTLVAFILVLVFGSPIFVDWVNNNTRADTAGGLFLRTLAWPAWSFNSHSAVRDVLAQDLKAVLFIVLVAVFLTVLAGAELSRARGTIADLVTGWSAVIFAAALAGFITAFASVHAGLYTALLWALGGASYGLITGWIVALAQQGTRRP